MIIPADMPAALSRLGLDYEIRGDELKARCPSGNHQDYHPSWSVNSGTGAHHCFSCGFSGSFVSLAAFLRHTDYDSALTWCMRLPLKAVAPSAPREPARRQVSLAAFTAPPEKFLRDKKLSLDAAAEYELLWDDGSWVAPIRDPFTGELWGYQQKNAAVKRFRNVPDDVQKSRALFGYRAIRLGSPAVLVEAPIDAVRLRTAGITGAVASYGVHVSCAQLELLGRARYLVLALDNDEDGFRQTERILRTGVGRPIRVFEYGDTRAKDPGLMTDAEILRGIEESVSGILWRNGDRNWRQ